MLINLIILLCRNKSAVNNWIKKINFEEYLISNYYKLKNSLKMKLILRNQIIKSAQIQNTSSKFTSRALAAFSLAGVLAGVNFYFQNFIANQDN